MLLSPRCPAAAAAASAQCVPGRAPLAAWRPALQPPTACTTSGRPALTASIASSSSASASTSSSHRAAAGRHRSRCLAPPLRASAGGPEDSTQDSGDNDAAAARQLKETAALDELIDVLLAARTQQELARLVAENIVAIDKKKFWMRVATRNDTASSPEVQKKLPVMAEAVMLVVDTVMKKTEQQLSDSGKTLQDILTAASEDSGEWYLPLSQAQVASVRAALDRHADRLDEALLSNAFAWIRKCTEDGFDTMAQLIQKVLQLYAARALQTSETAGVEGAVNAVVYAEEHEWAPLVAKFVAEGVITEPAFMQGLQKRMESTVLGLQSGSYAQRVQAEYLKEVEARAKQVFKEVASTSSSP